MGSLNFRAPQICKMELVTEGLKDWEYISHVRKTPKDEVSLERAAKRAARSYAAAYGIKYWPAFMGPKNYQPSRDAMVAAEAVLAPLAGGYYGDLMADGTRCHGGFDSNGHNGLSGGDIRHLWFQAGCKDTPKFRFMVREWYRSHHMGRVQFRKGDSLPFAKNFARGRKFMDGFERHYHCLTISRKAIAALGRLSPEAQMAAMEGLKGFEGVVRIRDLNWGKVKEVTKVVNGSLKVRAAQSILQRGGHIRRAAKLLGINIEEGWDAVDPVGSVVMGLTPQYPRIGIELSAKICLGLTTPTNESGLSSKLAHQWMVAGAPSEVAIWLADHLQTPRHRSVKVVQWMDYLKRKGWWGEMEKSRTQRIAGEEHRFTVLQILDEIMEEDIVSGKEGVNVVLHRASARGGEEFFAKNKEDFRTLRSKPWWVEKMPKGTHYLNTPAALAWEGKHMDHCVGTYISAVENAKTNIVSVETRYGRSTVELGNELHIHQHRGVGNAEPPKRNKQLVDAWIARMTRHVA